jgi:hypothetical protein
MTIAQKFNELIQTFLDNPISGIAFGLIVFFIITLFSTKGGGFLRDV